MTAHDLQGLADRAAQRQLADAAAEVAREEIPQILAQPDSIDDSPRGAECEQRVRELARILASERGTQRTLIVPVDPRDSACRG